MSKKVKGRNAFYFFMVDWCQKQKNGKKSLKEAAVDPKCNEEWRNMTPQQKGIYEARAKDSKVKSQKTAGLKTAIGESMKDVEAREREEKEFEELMHQYIESVVLMGKRHNSLEKLKFMFIHVNWYFGRDVGINTYEFCPAEFALAEFSLKDGIVNVYHEILKVTIPLGWRADAIEFSQQTHQIPIELAEGQSDFQLMYSKFINILETNKTGNKFPPLFTIKEMTPAVESLLIKMTKAGNGSIEDFVVYSIEALFGELRNAAVQDVDDQSIPLVIAENEFKKDKFSSVRDLECDFHKNIDGTSLYCSKAVVRRWGFTICDYCCEYVGITPINDIHCPIPQSYVHQDDQNNEKQDASSIDFYLKNLNIADKRKFIEMNGVSQDHRRKVSERNYNDEQHRRNLCKPLEIIDHSKIDASASSSTVVDMPSRPLRLPKTMAQALNGIEDTSNLFKQEDFPVIGGRGIMSKKQTTEIKFPLGRGRGYH
ncbi:protein maelstrom 2 [Xylocopa sonorina]|uniref:protein maelstrom 2 n=1 Tax=Xylocopa sonorina TaxID=1818115 RepID=UPI00403AD632